MGGEHTRREPQGTGLRARADAPLQRALCRARSSRLAVRGAGPGLAGTACAEPAPASPRHQHRWGLLAAVQADDRRRGDRARRPDQRRAPRRPVGGCRGPQAGEVDGAHAAAPRGARDVRRGRGLRLPRGPCIPGARLDAATRPRVDLPAGPGAAQAPPAVRLLQSPFRTGLRSPVAEPALAVVVVTHENAAHVAETLRVVSGQMAANDELVVVDNASTDGTREIA